EKEAHFLVCRAEQSERYISKASPGNFGDSSAHSAISIASDKHSANLASFATLPPLITKHKRNRHAGPKDPVRFRLSCLGACWTCVGRPSSCEPPRQFQQSPFSPWQCRESARLQRPRKATSDKAR
ncbi:hypothetical protein PTTG_27246, partial [Puccinia triticina 1-1 BBBD Race 1]